MLVILDNAVLIFISPLSYLKSRKMLNKNAKKNINNAKNTIKNNIPANVYSIQIHVSGASPKNSCTIVTNILFSPF